MKIHINPPTQPADASWRHRTLDPSLYAGLLVAQVRVEEHHRGEHPVGSMRRDCPLCVGNVA